MSTNEESGLLDKILSRIFETEKPEEDEEYRRGQVDVPSIRQILEEQDVPEPKPSSPSVVEAAMEKLRSEGLIDEKRSLSDFDQQLEELGDPVRLVEEFESVIDRLSDRLLPIIRQRERKEERGIDTIGLESVEQTANVTGMEYIIYENENGMIVGGASNFMRNLSDRLGLSEIEEEVVKHAYNEALRQTGIDELTAHTTSSATLYIPKDEEGFERVATEETAADEEPEEEVEEPSEPEEVEEPEEAEEIDEETEEPEESTEEPTEPEEPPEELSESE